MSYTYDYLVFIGRFQPLHNGHLEVMKRALQLSQNLIVLVGSANSSRCPRNPFTFAERQHMISTSLVRENFAPIADRLHVLPLDDIPYNDTAWVAQVQRKVNTLVTQKALNPFYAKVGLIGHGKDNSSYYLKMFPTWGSVNVEAQSGGLSATELRHEYFIKDYSVRNVPEPVDNFLATFRGRGEWYDLADWYVSDARYKESWAKSPYPVIITCVDSVVVQSGHVLLVRRKAHPGRGLLALPGGHVEQEETFRSAAIRELKEETRIADDKGEIPPAMLSSFIDDTATRLFDYPYRSSRARVITQAYLFRLPDRKQLFTVRGDDDAESASWFPLGDLKANEMFEDHYHIIETTLGGL